MSRATSKTDSVATPQYILSMINRTYQKVFDPVPLVNKFDPSKHPDALKMDWHKYKVIWINPPFSKMRFFVKKCFSEFEKNNDITIILLMKTQTLSTKYFNELYKHKNIDIHFFNHKLRFPGYTNDLTSSVILLVFSKHATGRFYFVDGRDGTGMLKTAQNLSVLDTV